MKIEFDVKSLVDEGGTQTDFSEKTGIHINVIGNLYRGVTMVSLNTLARIMEATGKEPNDLFVVVESNQTD